MGPPAEAGEEEEGEEEEGEEEGGEEEEEGEGVRAPSRCDLPLGPLSEALGGSRRLRRTCVRASLRWRTKFSELA